MKPLNLHNLTPCRVYPLVAYLDAPVELDSHVFKALCVLSISDVRNGLEMNPRTMQNLPLPHDL